LKGIGRLVFWSLLGSLIFGLLVGTAIRKKLVLYLR